MVSTLPYTKRIGGKKMCLLEPCSWNDFSNLVILKSKQYHYVTAHRGRVRIAERELPRILERSPELQLVVGEGGSRSGGIQNIYCRPERSQPPEDEYFAALFSLYEHVSLLKNEANMICGYSLQGMKSGAGDAFSRLLKERKFNPYVSMLLKNRVCACNNRAVQLFHIKEKKNTPAPDDPFLRYLTDASVIAGVCSVPLAGYEMSDFQTIPRLRHFIAHFSNLYVMFCGEMSTSVYLLGGQSGSEGKPEARL